MLQMALAGALISGAYGVVHDQITYSISPEYFTRFKFSQFMAADFGFPARVFVAEIGFLATWWVGFFSGWFMGRLVVPAWPRRDAWRRVGLGFMGIAVVAVTAGVVGYLLGLSQDGTGAYWVEMCGELGVEDVEAFARVGYIHNAGYLGGLVGLMAAVAWLVLARKRRGGKIMR